MKNKGVSNTIRKSVLERDNYECRKCGEEDRSGKILEIHHKDPFFKNKNNNLNNLITLCSTCHRYAPNFKEDFEDYLTDQISPLLVIAVKAHKSFREKYTPKEWEEFEKQIEEERRHFEDSKIKRQDE